MAFRCCNWNIHAAAAVRIYADSLSVSLANIARHPFCKLLYLLNTTDCAELISVTNSKLEIVGIFVKS